MNPVHLVGRSAPIREVEREALFAAQGDATVLIAGETGVDKEAIARFIHRHSPRSYGGLVRFRCRGVPDALVASGLFGHVRNSFTGAYQDKPGLLESVPGGTMFLDEIGELSLRTQPLLLRFLQSGDLWRVGADRGHTRVNVRLIAGTDRDLYAQVRAGTFRRDLNSILNMIRIPLPPLRDRRDDIPLLVDHFVQLCCGAYAVPPPEISRDAVDSLCGRDWSGNERELKDVVERIVLKAWGGRVTVDDLRHDAPPERSAAATNAETADPAPALLSAMIDHGASS